MSPIQQNEPLPGGKFNPTPAAAHLTPVPGGTQPSALVPMPVESNMEPNVADGQLVNLTEQAEESVLGPQDLAMPRLVIAQPTSNFEGASEHSGQWFNSVTGEYAAELNVVVVRVAIQRALFPEPYSADLPVLCASRDAISPYPEYQGHVIEGITIYNKCGECPLQEWGEEDPVTHKGKPPRCSLMYMYTMIDVDTGLPATVRLKSTALQAAKKLNLLYTQFKHTQVIRLGTTPGKGSRKYFIPTIALAKQATPDYIMDGVRALIALGRRDAAEMSPVVPEDEPPF